MNTAEVRKDIERANGYWEQLRPGLTPEQFTPLICLLAARAEPLARHADALLAEVEQLRQAIGVCVPSVIRCFIQLTPSGDDRELAQRVLARVEAAMTATEPPGAAP